MENSRLNLTDQTPQRPCGVDDGVRASGDLDDVGNPCHHKLPVFIREPTGSPSRVHAEIIKAWIDPFVLVVKCMDKAEAERELLKVIKHYVETGRLHPVAERRLEEDDWK